MSIWICVVRGGIRSKQRYDTYLQSSPRMPLKLFFEVRYCDGVTLPSPLSMLGRGWPDSPAAISESLVDTLKGHGFPIVDVGVIELPLGTDPAKTDNVDGEVLARCRAVELRSFLERGEAIWRPKGYHYRLPSGQHAATFVRVADAFRDPRASVALASWLYGPITENSAVVVDSGTLMPLVLQVDAALRLATAAQLKTGSRGLSAIDSSHVYPRSRFEYLKRFGAFEGLHVVALLSVTSSGRTYRMIRDTLDETAGTAWRAECLVTRENEAAMALPPSKERGRQLPWLALGDEALSHAGPQQCRLCREIDSARIVEVDPRAFAAMVLPSPERIMPDIYCARRNSSLMNAYTTVSQNEKAVSQNENLQLGVQVAPREIRIRRPNTGILRGDRERVYFEPLVFLVDQDRLVKLILDRIGALRSLPDRDPSRGRILKSLNAVGAGKPTVVVCDREEVQVLNRILKQIDGQRGTIEESHLSYVIDDASECAEDKMDARDQKWSEAEKRFLSVANTLCSSVRDIAVASPNHGFGNRLDSHRSVLLVVAGLQRGVTLQHLVVSVQDSFKKRGISPEMRGLVVHAHPRDQLSWDSVRNSFRAEGGNSHLLALWLTYLPQISPFRQEYEVLNVAPDEWFAGSRNGRTSALLSSRRAWLDPNISDAIEPPNSPLLSPVRMELRRTSLYGDLDDRHTVVAVGAAMQEELQRYVHAGTPEWVRFDLLNALRSYFDGLIHVAILRWLTPERGWWGRGRQ